MAQGKSVVIVESPAKARTINKFLGKQFIVRASMGHVRDLPKSKLGIDIENGFEPEYRVIRGRGKTLKELQESVKKADKIYLATDPDREGEAIAWHLMQALDLPEEKVYRVVFNEITRAAIEKAFANPIKVSMDKVWARQARRLLDRIVDYQISPLLGSKVAKGLSADRVQSVAVRLIAEREQLIRAFVADESWKIGAEFTTPDDNAQTLTAELSTVDGKQFRPLSEAETEVVVARLEAATFGVQAIQRKEQQEPAGPPLSTSLLQQQASTRLHFSVQKTMLIARQLYEGIDVSGEGSVGLISYMRTDSFRIADEALGECRDYIESSFGDEFLPEAPNSYASPKRAQEAHEAIRPTRVLRDPERLEQDLTGDQYKLYKLIWERFVASQMTPAAYRVTSVEIVGDGCLFRLRGKELGFEGHARVSGINISSDEQALPALTEGQAIDCKQILPTQHSTEPPSRYTEASLVQLLEQEGIGRPSTYAPIISTIQDCGYVELEQRCFHATELGILVTDLLLDSFPTIVDSEFTSSMEAQLDQIAASEMDWREVLQAFYEPFSILLAEAEIKMPNLRENPQQSERTCDKCDGVMVYLWNIHGRFLGCSNFPDCRSSQSISAQGDGPDVVETEHLCDKCESRMVIKDGRNGKFLACSAYPECKNTFSVDEDGNPIRPKQTEHACEKCGKSMVLRSGRRGPFLACSGYPGCRSTRSVDPDGNPIAAEKCEETCEECQKPMVVKSGRRGKFLACTGYPACRNTASYKGKNEAELAGIDCDKCGKSMVVRSGSRGPFVACSGYPECRNTRPMDEVKAELEAR